MPAERKDKNGGRTVSGLLFSRISFLRQYSVQALDNACCTRHSRPSFTYGRIVRRDIVFVEIAPNMIIDTFERGARYPLGKLWNTFYPELLELVRQGESLPEGRYPLAGGPEKGGVMVSVESYTPRQEADARYESHDVMADIQAVLAGDEFIDVFFLRGDEKESLRDDERDLVFYSEKPEHAVRVHLTPGMFALVTPGEAHMPCLKAHGEKVKKLVVKIPARELPVPPAV